MYYAIRTYLKILSRLLQGENLRIEGIRVSYPPIRSGMASVEQHRQAMSSLSMPHLGELLAKVKAAR